MFRRPTLFVVGAGASAELGFPIGFTLRDQIANLLNIKWDNGDLIGSDKQFNKFLTVACTQRGIATQDICAAANHVSRNIVLSSSVDSYLDSHTHNPLRSLCAKMAIAHLILQYENQSPLRCASNEAASQFSFSGLEDTWLQRMWSILQVGITPDNVANSLDSIRFITFNYDRCIEQFLHLALANFFDMDLNTAKEKVDGAGIVHIYGDLGEISAHPGDSFDFKEKSYRPSILAESERIKTFTERLHSEVPHRINELVAWCETIVFLGFSFNSVNCNLISNAISEHSRRRRAYATSYKMSDEASAWATLWLDGQFSQHNAQARVRPDKSFQLFDRYSNEF